MNSILPYTKEVYGCKQYAASIGLLDTLPNIMYSCYNVGTTTIDKVNRLASITADQSKSKLWFKYWAGRITASRFRQVIHTSPDKPSLSLLNSICYPDIYRFCNDATKWGCSHETDALQAYERKNATVHEDFVTFEVWVLCQYWTSISCCLMAWLSVPAMAKVY